MRSARGRVVVDGDNFARRIIADAFTEATETYWRDKRAVLFEWARPRPGDYCAKNSEQVAEQDRRLAEIAEACRNRARLARVADADLAATVDTILEEVA